MRNDILSIILGSALLSGMLVSVYAQPPIERLPSTIPVLKDQSGRELFQVAVGKLTFIEATLSSQIRNQTFAYIVQIKDDKEFTVLLSWLTGQLLRNQELKVSQSWVPEEEGDYFIEIFVWSAIDNPDPLSPPSGLGVHIFPENQAPAFDFAISTDPESLKIQKGKSDELFVTIEPIGEEAHNVRLLLDNVPNGMSVALEQDFIGNRPPYSLPIKISVANSVVLGTYSFDIVGESGAIHRSVTVKVTVVKEDLK